MTVKPPPASYHQDMKVCQYAIMTFESKLARQRACKLGGTVGGRELTVGQLSRDSPRLIYFVQVSIAVSDLPEVREKISKRLEDYRLRMEPLDVHRAQQSALR